MFLESAICCFESVIWLTLCMLHAAPAALCSNLEKARQSEHAFFTHDFTVTKSLWHTEFSCCYKNCSRLTTSPSVKGETKVWAGNLGSKYILICFLHRKLSVCSIICYINAFVVLLLCFFFFMSATVCCSALMVETRIRGWTHSA